MRNRSSAAALAPLTQPPECFIAVNRLYATAFQVVVPAVEHTPDFTDRINEPGDGVLREFIRTAPRLRSQFLELLLEIRGEMHFHTSSGYQSGRTPVPTGCQF